MIEGDLDASSAAGEGDRVAQVLRRRAAAGVEAVDLRAPTAKQFDQSEIVVVPAVADVEERRIDPIAASSSSRR
jgi:hypothetical protein